MNKRTARQPLVNPEAPHRPRRRCSGGRPRTLSSTLGDPGPRADLADALLVRVEQPELERPPRGTRRSAPGSAARRCEAARARWAGARSRAERPRSPPSAKGTHRAAPSVAWPRGCQTRRSAARHADAPRYASASFSASLAHHVIASVVRPPPGRGCGTAGTAPCGPCRSGPVRSSPPCVRLYSPASYTGYFLSPTLQATAASSCRASRTPASPRPRPRCSSCRAPSRPC